MAINKMKALYYSLWLEWQIDSNWTDPFVFLVFTIVKPLTTALTFFLMYYIIIGNFLSPFFGFIFIGSTFNAYLSLVLYNSIWMVHADRESYQTLKYIYITNTPLWLYYMGRLLFKFVAATISSVVILTTGVLVVKIPINMNPFWFIITMLLGILMILSLGYIFAFMAMLIARHSEGIASSLNGLFFLLSGTVFPIDVLPSYIRAISLTLPTTYWFALLRRSVLGYDLGMLSPLTYAELFLYTSLTSILLIFIAILMYKVIDYFVRKKGAIDMTTNY
ncbi:MAG: ABC transporter permease [Candidatus Njordarchaeia archaeon]